MIQLYLVDCVEYMAKAFLPPLHAFQHLYFFFRFLIPINTLHLERSVKDKANLTDFINFHYDQELVN